MQRIPFRSIIRSDVVETFAGVERELLENIGQKMGRLVLDKKVSAELRRKHLRELDKYLERKLKKDVKTSSQPATYLKSIRSSLVHGPSASDADIDRAVPLFWDLLSRSTSQWDRRRLLNLLSYAIGDLDSETPVGTLAAVRAYERLLDKKPEAERRARFTAVLLSLYPTPEFQQALREETSKDEHAHGE